MTAEHETVATSLRQALTGRGAHVLTSEIFNGLDWDHASRRPEAAPHSVFQILNHLVYWQEFALQWLGGEKPATPEHAADSWPGAEAPASPEEWETAVERFQTAHAEFERRCGDGDLYAELGPKTALEIIQLIASHNSYHAGQVATLRRMLGKWPPPGGGATW